MNTQRRKTTYKRTAAAAFAALLFPAGSAAQSAESPLAAQRDSLTDGQAAEQSLGAATVSGRRKAVMRMEGAENGLTLSRQELFKAACCNLGESFTTNPSVDVSYTDAATGARQIKLLGLAGTYVQMLTENIPAYRGAAAPYALGYVPGPWMQSIQVSKGSASVKNGYESLTGQINVEFKKPQAAPSVEANLFGDTNGRAEANFDGNIHMGEKLSTALLLHYEDEYASHDGNGDGFADRAKVRQYHAMNRWAWVGERYIFQAGASALKESRDGGQTHSHGGGEAYKIGIDTERYSAFAKNAFILDKEHGTNLALILSGTYHQGSSLYGRDYYDVRQRTGYASLLFETSFSDSHSLSAGLSLNHDYYNQHTNGADNLAERERETVPGIYAQYTYTLDSRLVLMAGLRGDHSSVYGAFFTPRFHLKYSPSSLFALRLSAGKGYRTPHALAENSNLLATGRRLVLDTKRQEEAWNYGASLNFKIPAGGHILDLNAEYYYTRFLHQTLADMDSRADEIRLADLQGRSFSHTMQVDATYTFGGGVSLTAAYRYNIVKATYGGVLMEKPLTSRYKALLTASWKSRLELWQLDATVQLNGGGRLPLHYADGNDTPVSDACFKPFAQVNFQATRWFKHWSVYVGGENLTNFRQKHPILAADNPWSSRFDAVTQVWGPTMGAMGYAGVRVHF